jgi:FkbM family methyltransferase
MSGGSRAAGTSWLGAVPGAGACLRWAGTLPPALRSRYSLRACEAVARRVSPETRLAPTNFGIDRRLKCRVPSTQAFARFGKPDLYRGERGPLQLAARLAQDASAFVDVGAHLGYFTFFVRTRGATTVPIVFVEPDPVLFGLLQDNVVASGLSGVTGLNVAVADADGERTFHRNLSDTLSGSLTDRFGNTHQLERVTVRVMSAATLVETFGYSGVCMKVDVEHAEKQFLEGARPILDRIAYLIIEVLGPAHAAGFVRELADAGGFQAYYINDYSLEPSADGRFVYREPEYNWLFCRDDPAALRERLSGLPFRILGG